MKILIELVSEALKLSFGIFILGLILKVFFKHTLIGKIISVVVMDTFLLIRWWFKKIKQTGLFILKHGKKINKVLKNKTNKKKISKSNKNKKVVNGGNVVDFQSAKQLRHKWNK